MPILTDDPDAEAYSNLPDRRKKFVDAYFQLGASRGDGAQAARLAGYSPDRLAGTAYELLKNREVLMGLRHLTRTLGQEGTLAAMEYMIETAKGDNGAPHPVRLAAAKDLLDRGGLQARLDRKIDIQISDNRDMPQVLESIAVLAGKLKTMGVTIPAGLLEGPIVAREKVEAAIEVAYEDVTDESNLAAEWMGNPAREESDD